MRKKLLILSPHLDDAAISTGAHILKLHTREDVVLKVLTIFTSFGSGEPSDYQKKFMREQGFVDVEAYQRCRLEEDHAAMQVLNIGYEYCGFCDAAFRRDESGELLYPDYRQLTPFHTDSASRDVLTDLEEILRVENADEVWVPSGVGGHVDHMITKDAAEAVWDRGELGYYLEFPYALRPWKYRPQILGLLSRRRISALPMTELKKEALANYRSQMPYLFPRGPRFREVLLLPRNSSFLG